jgi:hypothetical protein
MRTKIRQQSPYRYTLKESMSNISFPNVVNRNFKSKIPNFIAPILHT